uniref:Glycosyl hydrolase Rv2006/MT2062 family n=1 Tax=Cajanus cajan TaxID=3821 RepID=A0A151TQG5_CAJCA|nr:putative glycosyl hydrolase Rv2006/MT2062 family [Cajanus cajan]
MQLGDTFSMLGHVDRSISSYDQGLQIQIQALNNTYYYPCLRLTHGRKVLQVRPVIDWDKGKAVTFLLESLGETQHNCDDVLAIYVGDNVMPQIVLFALREVNKGCGILVSPVPKETNAVYSLRDLSEVIS